MKKIILNRERPTFKVDAEIAILAVNVLLITGILIYNAGVVKGKRG